MPETSHDRWQHHEREHSTADASHRREHEADAKAIKLAVDTVDRRLGELNELRREVIEDRSQFMRRETHNADIKGLENRINTVEKMLDRAEGAVNTWRFIAGFLGVGGIAAVVWALINMPR